MQMISIKKGQYFTNQNNNEYIFLGFKNPNIIYAVDNNFDSTGEIFLFDVDVIENLLDKYNKTVKELNWYYQCKEEFENSTLSDKINYLLNNLKHDFREWEKDADYLNIDIRLKDIGALVSGKAYYADQNEYYEVIGFLVDTETYKNNKKMEDNKGVFAVYHSKCGFNAPMNFFNQETETRFSTKGSDDFFEVENVLLNKKEIESYIKQNNIKLPTFSDKEELGISE